MNNACPACGAVYAVENKDIGRKIKCKKCNTALLVDDTGLVLDAPVAAAVAPPPAGARDKDNADDHDAKDDGGAAPRKKAKRFADREPGPGFGEFLAKIGGVPTILFGVGLFFTLYFFFQAALSQASIQRATGAHDRVKLEQQQRLRKLTREEEQLHEDLAEKLIEREQHDLRMKDIEKDRKKIKKDYLPKLDAAEDDKDDTTISTKRWAWFDQFGLLIGFLLLSFGCVGYLRTEQPLYVRIVAGVILCVMMMAIFGKFSGCQLR